MMPLVALLGGVWGRLAAAGAALLAVGGALLAVRQGGRDSQRATDLKQDSDDDAKANQARAAVARLPDGAAADELRADWNRDKPGSV